MAKTPATQSKSGTKSNSERTGHRYTTDQTSKQSDISSAEETGISALQTPFSPDPSPQAGDAQQQLADHLRTHPDNQRSRLVLQLQRQYGNRYTNQVVQLARTDQVAVTKEAQPLDPLLQRDPAPVAAAPAAEPLVWQAPFDMGDASTRREAIISLVWIQQGFIDLRNSAPISQTEQANENIHGIQTVIDSLAQEMRTDPALTADDINRLNILAFFAKSANDSIRSAISAAVVPELTSLSNGPAVDTKQSEAEVNAALQKAFEKGDTDQDRLSKLAKVLDNIKEYKEKVDNVRKWAERTNSIAKNIKAAEFLETFKKDSETFGTGLKRVREVVTVAQAIQTLSADNGGVTSASDDINKFRAGLDLIDVGMSFTKAVPLLGTLWSSYYGPVTRACLNMIERIADMKREEWRGYTYEVEMREAKKGPDGVPIIPKDALTYFPGGQPVYNFMYQIINGGSPTASSEVEQFFLRFKKRFNAAEEKNNAMPTESRSDWYKPWTWGDEGAPRLLPWIQAHQDIIWAQLYGNLQRNL